MNNSNPVNCNPKIYSIPICLPDNSSLWYNGTFNLVSWDITNILYYPYDKLNLYFYYRNEYQFTNTINFTNIGAKDGYYSVFINNNWFPSCEENKTWNYTALLVGNDINPEDQINNKVSKWKRIDFNVVQNGTCSDNIPSNTSNSQNTNSNPNNIKLENWKIAVIVICCSLFIIICLILIKIKFFKKMKNKDIEIKIIEKEIIINDGILQKPNEIDFRQKN